MTELILNGGHIVLIDDTDLHLISGYNWAVFKSKRNSTFYAYSHAKDETGRTVPKTILMHRFLLGVTFGKTRVDHKNGNGLDNQRCNLRPATSSQNAANSKVKSNSRTGIKGVRWHKRDSLWQARIRVNGREISLGYFKNINDAREAYRKGSVKHFGEFARTK